MELSFSIENLGGYLSIFHNSRDWASFSPHFCIILWMLQPLTSNCINTTFKMKNTVCAETPCSLHLLIQILKITSSFCYSIVLDLVLKSFLWHILSSLFFLPSIFSSLIVLINISQLITALICISQHYLASCILFIANS